MKNTLLLFFISICFFGSAQNIRSVEKSDSCTLSLCGKKNGTILLKDLQKTKRFDYSDTNNCDYRLRDIEVVIKDIMGMDIVSQTTPGFLDDLKKAIEKMKPGTKLTVTAVIWTDKKHTAFFTQVMKFDIK